MKALLVEEVKFQSRLRGQGFKSLSQILVYGLYGRILFREKKFKKKNFKTGLVKKSRQKNLDLIGIKSN